MERKATPYLDSALKQFGIIIDSNDRYEILCAISDALDLRRGDWFGFAKQYNLLDSDHTAEDFSLEFMSAFNKECYPKY